MRKKDNDIIRRSRILCKGKRGEGPVVYWMERDQRLEDNWALLYARQEALIRKKPLLVVYFIDAGAVQKISIQTSFLLHGLDQLSSAFAAKNIGFLIIKGAAEKLLPKFCKKIDAHLLVTDFSPLHHKQKSVKSICKDITMPFDEVDAHNIIPAWITSTKKEYAAYTIRPKIHRLLDDYLTSFPAIGKHPYSLEEINTTSIPKISSELESILKVGTGSFKPGQAEAKKQMRQFIDQGLDLYEEQRNNPTLKGQSELSPYLHFGQLAPQLLALEVRQAEADQEGKDSFLEELVVRRELSDNFCLYETNYDNAKGFHPWARKTLEEHRKDNREYTYSLSQLASCETHEELWNSCQRNLITNNKLHGYLRMYWAKKILEWTSSPEEALEIGNYLNDTYSIDGTDPNGYTGVAWSVGGVHDRAWPERPVFGKIRYMNERGCRRKFNVDQYIKANSK